MPVNTRHGWTNRIGDAWLHYLSRFGLISKEHGESIIVAGCSPLVTKNMMGGIIEAWYSPLLTRVERLRCFWGAFIKRRNKLNKSGDLALNL